MVTSFGCLIWPVLGIESYCRVLGTARLEFGIDWPEPRGSCFIEVPALGLWLQTGRGCVLQVLTMVKLWWQNMRDGEEKSLWVGSPVVDLDWVSGKFLLVTSDDRIELWDVTETCVLARLNLDVKIRCTIVIGEGHIAAGDEAGGVHFMDVVGIV